MVAPIQIGHIVFRVNDLNRSEQFYTEILGLRVTARELGMVFLSSSPERSHELALAPAKSPISPNGRQENLAHVAWQVDSFTHLQDFYDHLKEKSIPILGIGDHRISLGIYFLDPDGNKLEVFYELPKAEWREGPLFSGKFPLKLQT